MNCTFFASGSLDSSCRPIKSGKSGGEEVHQEHCPLTDIVIVEDGNLCPIEKVDQHPDRLGHGIGARMQVDRELFSDVETVHPRLEMRNVQRIAHRLHVDTESIVTRPEDCQRAVVDHVTGPFGGVETVVTCDILVDGGWWV